MAYTPDDDLPASQLRQRYKKLPDDQLTASQLRAKNAIPGNKFEHESSLLNPSTFVFALMVLMAILSGGLAFQQLAK